MEINDDTISSNIIVNEISQGDYDNPSKINYINFSSTRTEALESRISTMLAISGLDVFTPLTYCTIDGQDAGLEFSRSEGVYTIRVAWFQYPSTYLYKTLYTSGTGWDTSLIDTNGWVNIGKRGFMFPTDCVDIISVVTMEQNAFFWLLCRVGAYASAYLPLVDIVDSNKLYKGCEYKDAVLYKAQVTSESQKQTVQKNLGLERDTVVTENSNNLITSGAVFNYAKSYQAQDTDTIDTTIDGSTISSSLIVNKDGFEVGQSIDSVWFNASLTAEELGTKIISMFSDYDLSETFTLDKVVITGTYLDEEPTNVLWFEWTHTVTVEDPDLMGNGWFTIYINRQGNDRTKTVGIFYTWNYSSGEFVFDYDYSDNPHWYDAVVNQVVEMTNQPTITYVDTDTESIWEGEIVRNQIDISVLGISQGKVFDTNISSRTILTTEKQYLTAEQQAQVLENLGIVNAQNRYY